VLIQNQSEARIMYSDVVFARTAKGEREKANLPDNLKRTLLLINGQSASTELVKRAPPSLRQEWDELLGELLKDGYIANVIAAPSVRKIAARESAPAWTAQFRTAQPQPETASGLKGFFAAAKENAAAEATQAALEMAQARVALEATAARRSANARVKAGQRAGEDARAHAALEVAIAAAKARSDAEAKAQAEARQRDVNAARVRTERETFIVSAQARADAEAKQRAEKAARAHAEHEAVIASVQARAVELAKAQADARQREKEEALTRAELEAAIKATKRRNEAGTIFGGNTSQNVEVEIPASDAARLRDLEIESDTLKRLLSEAYQEIALLKNRIRS
jgi:anthranilate/para-aminobenzoate synthase component I